jgi:hypothetical protein
MLTQRQRSLRLGALVLFACLAAATIPLKAADPAGEIAQTVSGGDPSLVEAATSVDQPPSSPPAPAPSTPPAPSGTPAFARSQNVTINLINRLVERGVLTKQDATELIHMAEEDAAAARAEATAAAQATPPPPPEEDAVRVTYVPEVVKRELREEIKQEVMTQAREENWAAPRTFPDWISRFKFFADLRVRYEGDFFPSGNDNTGAFPNFNAINTGPPFDVRGTLFSPQLNVDQDRERFRLRARFGFAADLGENFTAGIRIATGENNSPVTTNQSLGLANQGQGGDFSRYAIWLDRAFLRYDLGGQPGSDFSISVGRFDNPFFSSELIWDDDLGFDGIAVQARYEVAKGITPFGVAGAFPVFNTDFNFSSNRPDKFASYDKYLYGGQLGNDWHITRDVDLKLAAAYYYFQNIQGKLSDPFIPLTAQDAGNTDDSRPAFAQKGNTYFPIRNIIPDATNDFGTINQFQYFGLATPFRELAFTGRIDYSHFQPVLVSLSGEYVRNVAFDGADIAGKAINNRGPQPAPGVLGPFVGGDTGWLVNLRVGNAALEKRWDWNVAIGYRYIETDAVVDGFNDSDFGLGGTNLKGYTIGGSLALASHVWLNLRWLSADSIAGPTFNNDIIQFDINARF